MKFTIVLLKYLISIVQCSGSFFSIKQSNANVSDLYSNFSINSHNEINFILCLEKCNRNTACNVVSFHFSNSTGQNNCQLYAFDKTSLTTQFTTNTNACTVYVKIGDHKNKAFII